jgi:hypothetical protein
MPIAAASLRDHLGIARPKNPFFGWNPASGRV